MQQFDWWTKFWYNIIFAQVQKLQKVDYSRPPEIFYLCFGPAHDSDRKVEKHSNFSFKIK